MLDRIKAESSWLGAEALPAGLTEINETIEAWAAASTPPAAPSASGLLAGRVDFHRCALGEGNPQSQSEAGMIKFEQTIRDSDGGKRQVQIAIYS